MIYLDNIIFSLQKAGGISVVWQNLIKNLLSSNNADKIRFLEYPGANQNIFRQKLNIPQEQIFTYSKFNSILEQFKSPETNLTSPFIFHSSYFRTCENPHAINVTTVHDFIYEQGKPTIKQKFRIWLNYKAIKNSDAIVCISENTRKDLFKFIPEINPDKVHVIHNGVSDGYYRIGSVPFPEYLNHVMFVGGRQGYKNFDFIVKTLGKTNYNLLICGSPLSSKEQKLLEKYLSHRYTVITYPSDEVLNQLYNSVFCLAYPSSYEGFGLPVIEAQRAGCPVIALNESSIPEVIGRDSLLMPQLSSNSFMKLIKELENSDKRQLTIDAGIKNAMNFSWRKMADEYSVLYDKLLSQ